MQQNTCPTISRPVWSPQGDRIAFSVGAHMGAPGPTHLALIRPDGSDLKMLTSGERHDGLPSWSPDGTRLVFRTVTGSRTGLSIIDIERGAITPLPTGSDYDTFPAWSPRGDLISFTSKRDDDYEIYVIRSRRQRTSPTDAYARQRCALGMVARRRVDCLQHFSAGIQG